MNISAKTIQIRIGNSKCSLQIPADPDTDMQRSWEQHGEDDLYFPFWLEAWPSSFGLYHFLLEKQIPLDGALELGCGCGTLAQLLLSEPGQIMHTDLVPGACQFLQRQLGDRKDRLVFAMDMTKPCLAHAPRLVLGADLFYEYRLVEYACQFVKSFMHPDGKAYFADPMRPSRPDVPKYITSSGVSWKKILWKYELDGKPKELAIWELSKTH